MGIFWSGRVLNTQPVRIQYLHPRMKSGFVAVLGLALVAMVMSHEECGDFGAPCPFGQVCCEGICRPGFSCCGPDACRFGKTCCAADLDVVWPTCCGFLSERCCKNEYSNWCCGRFKHCGD